MGMLTENNIRVQAKKDAEALRAQVNDLLEEQERTNELLAQILATLQARRS